MAYTKVKTRFAAQVDIEQYLVKHRNVYWWTFTEPGRALTESLWSKTEAEEALKPFLDLCRRLGIEQVHVWELQKRGSWHPHVLINKRLDVNRLRAFMKFRGWGPQMFVAWVVRDWVPQDKHGHPCTTDALRSYMTKRLYYYLTKARTDDALEPRKKFFGGSHSAKCATVKFSWNPYTDTAHSMLYSHGRSLWVEIYGTPPSYRDMSAVMNFGVAACDWLNVDFLYEVPYQKQSKLREFLKNYKPPPIGETR